MAKIAWRCGCDPVHPAQRQRRTNMIQHGPTCLDGPVTKARNWWGATVPSGVMETAEAQVTDNEFRPDLVRRVRAEIAAGTYDTPEKWELALGRLLDRLTAE